MGYEFISDGKDTLYPNAGRLFMFLPLVVSFKRLSRIQLNLKKKMKKNISLLADTFVSQVCKTLKHDKVHLFHKDLIKHFTR